jgi:hypothetical protein
MSHPYLVLGNAGYRQHMTDEGAQLQDGLAHAGWQLAGPGFQINESSVPKILDLVHPEIVFVQDVRDWDPRYEGCYDKAMEFFDIEVLREREDIKVATVVKDAASLVAGQRQFASTIDADAIVHYYHEANITT